MQRLCILVGKITLVSGAIASIILAWANGMDKTGIIEERSMFLTLIWFIVGIAVTCVEALIFFALGEILEQQKFICERLSVIESECASEEEMVNCDEWKCPRCGRINEKHVGVCGCGQRRDALTD